ncbi:hypothetical protein Tco_0118968 [Tanacetum coccineum]
MGDEHLNTISKTEKYSVKNLVLILSEFKGIFEDICDVPYCDNDHFDAEFGLINSLLSRDISITSPKINFLPEEFVDELDFIDPILPGINEDDFDEDDFDEDDFDKEEKEIEIDIFQIEDEILREKLLNVNLLVDKIEALKLTLISVKLYTLNTRDFANKIQENMPKDGICVLLCLSCWKGYKKKAKTSKKKTDKKRKRQVQERDLRKVIKARSARQQDKKVNETQLKSKDQC